MCCPSIFNHYLIVQQWVTADRESNQVELTLPHARPRYDSIIASRIYDFDYEDEDEDDDEDDLNKI